MNALRDLNWGTLYFFQFARHELPLLTQVLDWFVLLGHPLFLLALTVVAGAVLWAQHQPRAAKYLLLLTVTSALVSEALKWTLNWPRPQPRAVPDWMGPSLPSTSAVCSFVLGVALGRMQSARRVTFWGAVGTFSLWFLPVVLIAFALLFLNHNWLFDVVTGWLLAGIVLVSFEMAAGTPEQQFVPRSER